MVQATLTIAIAQPLVIPGAVERNLAAMETFICQAAEQGADVVLFSECGLTGYDLKGVALASAIPLDHPAIGRLRELASACGIVILNGLYERDGEAIHNTVIAVHPDGTRQVQHKHNLSPPEIADASPGPRQRTRIMIRGIACAVLICADYGIDGIHEEMADQGIQAVFLLTAGGGDARVGLHRSELAHAVGRQRFAQVQDFVKPPGTLASYARRFGCVYAASNQLGYDPSCGYFQSGSGSIVDRQGNLVVSVPGQVIVDELESHLAVGCAAVRSRPGKYALS